MKLKLTVESLDMACGDDGIIARLNNKTQLYLPLDMGKHLHLGDTVGINVEVGVGLV